MSRKIPVEAYILATLIMIVGGFVAGLATVPGGLGSPDDMETAAVENHDGYRLLVYETSSCGWCKRFRKDLAPEYMQTSYQQKAPLTYVQLHGNPPVRVSLSKKVSVTPTFVVIDSRGEERARLVGFPRKPSQFYDFVGGAL